MKRWSKLKINGSLKHGKKNAWIYIKDFSAKDYDELFEVLISSLGKKHEGKKEFEVIFGKKPMTAKHAQAVKDVKFASRLLESRR